MLIPKLVKKGQKKMKAKSQKRQKQVISTFLLLPIKMT
ncbi:hypothetical protein AWRI1631_30020 [Saccharomyces cerevisiae AWRI1631]|uniref:Uncharacterized protein n=1 Tax=Saccharomyces cerevisiae (strain AWRI1631) TaxID=545124 RepID=B5VEP4_YEAS6|nr:hypothetical protein AWRI1631_30020 [Saccharomyces cerevisiae AWRI1631]